MKIRYTRRLQLISILQKLWKFCNTFQCTTWTNLNVKWVRNRWLRYHKTCVTNLAISHFDMFVSFLRMIHVRIWRMDIINLLNLSNMEFCVGFMFNKILVFNELFKFETQLVDQLLYLILRNRCLIIYICIPFFWKTRIWAEIFLFQPL